MVVLGLWKALLEVDGSSLYVQFGLGLAVFSSLNLGREVAVVVEKGVCSGRSGRVPGHGVSGVPQVQPWWRLMPGATASAPRRELAGARHPPRRRVADVPDPAGPRLDPVPARQARACAWEGRRPVSGDGGCGQHGGDYGWRGGDGLRRRRSWLGATDSGRSGLWQPREVGAGGVLRVSVSCEGDALSIVSVATSVAHTARFS